MNGKKLIKAIDDRLESTGKLSTESNIILEIMKLTKAELNQLLSFGNVISWHNEGVDSEKIHR